MLLRTDTKPAEPADGDVHLWAVSAGVDGQALTALKNVLSATEIAAASRYRFEELQRAYVLRHGCLRWLIGAYLDIAARDVLIGIGEFGKPFLSDPKTDLRFNMSHSGPLNLFAFANALEVGVDIEQIRGLSDARAIAERFFSAEEQSDFRSIDDASILPAFYEVWTRKEAYVKAVGSGLSVAPASFCVTVRANQPAALVHISGDREAAEKWQIHTFAPTDGFVCSLAYSSTRRNVKFFGVMKPEQLIAAAEARDFPRFLDAG